MKNVTPYKTLAEAVKALDSGAGFLNLFSRAGDDIVSEAELGKAAGAFAETQRSLLFFEMATADLTAQEKADIVGRFAPKLKNRYEAERPTHINARDFTTHAENGRCCVVHGTLKRTDEDHTDMRTTLIPIGSGIRGGPSFLVACEAPVIEVFDVYEMQVRSEVTETLRDFGDPPPNACLVLIPKGSIHRPQGSVRIGGVARPLSRDAAEPPKSVDVWNDLTRPALQAAYYSEIR